MSKKNYFYRINPQAVLSELIFVDDKEKWFLQFLRELNSDDYEAAEIPLAKEIIMEAHRFREKRSKAGKASVEQKANKKEHMLTHVEHMLNCVATNVQQTSTNSSSNSSSNTKPIDDRFAEFWSVYPKKIGKGAAEASWRKINPSKEKTEQIIAAVAEQKKSDAWTKDRGQFIPNPSTWLNQRRWEDDLMTMPKEDPNNPEKGYPAWY